MRAAALARGNHHRRMPRSTQIAPPPCAPEARRSSRRTRKDMEAARAKAQLTRRAARSPRSSTRRASRPWRAASKRSPRCADPVGTIIAQWTRPNGLDIARVRVPLGVIGIIYESRPNVTCDAGALCLKSGNAAILRGGSESVHSSRAIHACLVAGSARGRSARRVHPARADDRSRRRGLHACRR